MKKQHLICFALICVATVLLACCGFAATPATVSFSQGSGLYEEGFAVTITTDLAGASIYYTTDGSTPTAASGTLYAGPVQITDKNATAGDDKAFQGTVLRAVATDGKQTTAVATATYLVSPDIKGRYPSMVASLSAAPGDLFSPENGIFHDAHVWDRGKESRREANLELFEADGSCVINQPIQMAISGNATRGAAKKSIKVYATEPKNIEYDIFQGNIKDEKGQTLDKFNSLVFRTGGNDWDKAVLRDPFIQSVAADLGIVTQGYRPCIVFVNGEYWGIYCLLQRYNDDFFEDNFGATKQSVVLLEAENENPVYVVSEGEPEDNQDYLKLIEYAETLDLSIDANYQKVAAMMDIDEFINYIILETYVANTDWPLNNVKVWRNKVADENYSDTRWQWCVMDTDLSLGWWESYYNVPTNPAHASITRILTEKKANWAEEIAPYSTALIRGLLQNDGFREKFVARYYELLDTVLKADAMQARFQAMADEIAPLMEESCQRWGLTYEGWEREVARVQQFLSQREGFVRQDLGNNFGKAHLRLFAVAGMGTISANGVTGDGITVNAGDAVTLRAIPQPGYKSLGFVVYDRYGKQTGYDTAEITLNPEASLDVCAVFAPEEELSVTPQLSPSSTGYLYVNEKGQLFGWGDNSYGQTGFYNAGIQHMWNYNSMLHRRLSYTYGTISAPTLLTGGVKFVAAGRTHSVVIMANGDVYTMGESLYGALGRSGGKALAKTELTGAVYAVAGWNSTLVITENGDAYGCGSLFGSSEFKKVQEGVTKAWFTDLGIAYLMDGMLVVNNEILFDDACDFITSGSGDYYCLLENGDLYGWGKNEHGTIGTGNSVEIKEPVKVASDVVAASLSRTNALFVTKDGNVYGLGDKSNGVIGEKEERRTQYQPALVTTGAKGVISRTDSSWIIKEDGSVTTIRDGKEQKVFALNGAYVDMEGLNAYVVNLSGRDLTIGLYAAGYDQEGKPVASGYTTITVNNGGRKAVTLDMLDYGGFARSAGYFAPLDQQSNIMKAN